MFKKMLAVVLGLSLVALATLAPSAEAKGRKCPRGQVDIADVCVPA